MLSCDSPGELINLHHCHYRPDQRTDTAIGEVAPLAGVHIGVEVVRCLFYYREEYSCEARPKERVRHYTNREARQNTEDRDVQPRICGSAGDVRIHRLSRLFNLCQHTPYFLNVL